MYKQATFTKYLMQGKLKYLKVQVLKGTYFVIVLDFVPYEQFLHQFKNNFNFLLPAYTVAYL